MPFHELNSFSFPRASPFDVFSHVTSQPYHDQMELSGSFWRYAVSHFLRSSHYAFSSYSSVFSADGAPLPSTLCTSVSKERGVLSAFCDDLASFVTPQPSRAFNSTACGWATEAVRPWFVGPDAAAEECATLEQSPPPVTNEPNTSVVGSFELVAALSFVCGVAFTFVLIYVSSRVRVHVASRHSLRYRRDTI